MRKMPVVAFVLLLVLGLPQKPRFSEKNGFLGFLNVSLPAANRVVNSAADSGPGTLRQALLEAAAGDTITFAPATFPPTAPVTITLLSPLPGIGRGTLNGLTVDASNASVVLDGSSITEAGASGLSIDADGVTVRGLQIVGFPGNGIELRGQGNRVGGDRGTGAGPLGQGNLLSGNGGAGIALLDTTTFSNTVQGNLIGVDVTGLAARANGGDAVHLNAANHNLIAGNVLSGNSGSGVQGCCTTDTSYNTIRDNLVGVGIDGLTAVPNSISGIWFHDGASHNIVGPGNVIAYNLSSGVEMNAASTVGNTVTGNSIFSNQAHGIILLDGSNGSLSAPTITGFELAAGAASGNSCAGCLVEIFSDAGGQGRLYEGQAQADVDGHFALDASTALSGPSLTATATDAAGNTSPFSAPTHGSGVEWTFQQGNQRPRSVVTPLRSPELADNRIGISYANLWVLNGLDQLLEQQMCDLGIKWNKTSVQEGEEPIDWSKPELSIEPEHDAWLSANVSHGITLTYYLNFWDKANHPAGWTGITSRFKTAEDVDRFKTFVQFIVTHFRDRVRDFEIWSEPDNDASPVQFIEPADYVSVTHAVIPIIRAAFPEARIAVGGTSYLKNTASYQYMLAVVRSDLMPLVDVVTWHPMFGASPTYADQRQYYYDYPDIVQQLKDEAHAHGFQGEFRGEDLVWRSPDCPWCPTEDPLYTNLTAAKYLARGIVMHLGLDMGTSVTSMSSQRQESFATVRNLSTLMAGAHVSTFPVQVQSMVTNVVTYTFDLPGGGRMVALWNDGVALDEDPGADTTLTLPGLANWAVTGVDPLHGIQQPLNAENDGADLVVKHLKLKDYPLLLRLGQPWRTYLPAIRR
jgi:parallel beta-helix repeat protein